MKKFFYLLFLTIILPGIPETTMAQGDYLIGPEDVLEISVWGHDNLKKTMAVSLEGAITFPLIGEIRAAEIHPGAGKRTLPQTGRRIFGKSPDYRFRKRIQQPKGFRGGRGQ